MKDRLNSIKLSAESELKNAADLNTLETLRVKYLGKKGELTAVMKGMGKLSKEERPVIGQLANKVRSGIESALEEKKKALTELAKEMKLKAETIDVALPGRKPETGAKHPLTTVLDDLQDIFIGMGFSIVEGPEVELDYYNFEALNLPPDHPARDTQDTFYISDNVLLRTQTSPVQVRYGKAKAAHTHNLARQSLQKRHGRRHSLACVPPGRGSRYRQGHNDGRP